MIEASLIVAIIVAVALGFAIVNRSAPIGAPGVLAARGGASVGSSATLTVTPNPLPAWSSFQGSGCGYTVGKQVNINVNGPAWKAGFPVGVDSSGCIAFKFWVDGPGSYTVKASQNLSGHKQTVLASVVLTAY